MWGRGKQERARALMAEGRALERAHDREGALARYQEAAALAPRWGEPHRAAGELELACGRARPARDAFSRALEVDPDGVAAYWGRSRALRRSRSFRAALADLRRLFELGERAMREKLAAELAELELLVLLQELPEPTEVDADLLEPADARRLEELVRALEQGQARTAGRGAQTLLDRYPGHPGLLAQRALAHLALGNVAQAVDDCIAGAASHSDDPTLRHARGAVLLALHDFEGAERELSNAICCGGDNVTCRIARARARIGRGDRTRAREDLERALEWSPDHPAALALATELAP